VSRVGRIPGTVQRQLVSSRILCPIALNAARTSAMKDSVFIGLISGAFSGKLYATTGIRV